MARVGFIGWRGMVGSVLMDRMRSEGDFKGYEPLFFSTSQVGQKAPDVGLDTPLLTDAFDVQELSKLDAIVTCQGGDYTKKVYPELRNAGWRGYWIDAASTLRMEDDSIIVLDPVNADVIERSLSSGIKNYIGSNCTVSLMLMAIGGLFQKGLVEWVTTMTYQAASGAGAKNMRELVSQMDTIGESARELLSNPASSALDLDSRVLDTLRASSFPTEEFGVPLAASLIPWIDRPMDTGQSREEWKGQAEANKILGTDKTIPIDGTCVRVGAMRCHSQGLCVKLTRDVPVDELEGIITQSNPWVNLVPNEKEQTLKELSPAAVSGSLTIGVGRVRKLNIGPQYLNVFTVGDQLLWGAAEPIRRMLPIVLEKLG